MRLIVAPLSLIAAVTALSVTENLAIVHGNLTLYSSLFSPENAIEKPFELVDDHEDLVEDHIGRVFSLKKRKDDCQQYHKGMNYIKERKLKQRHF
jgi:hypothetical protein